MLAYSAFESRYDQPGSCFVAQIETPSHRSVERDCVAIIPEPSDAVCRRLASATLDQFVAGVVRRDDHRFALAGSMFEQVKPHRFAVFGPIAFAEIVEKQNVRACDSV